MALAALIAVGLLLPSLIYPYGRDQAVFAYVGSVMARGGMPYRDAWDLKPPGIYLAYATLARLAPTSAAGLMLWLRIADIAVAAGVSVLLAAIARRCGHPEAALAAAGWYACLYLQGGYWGLAQAEAWANLFLLGALYLCLREQKGTLSGLFSIGLLGGVTAVLKFTALLPLCPFLWQAARKLHREERVRGVAALLVGLAVPLAGAGWWLVARGAWMAYAEIQRGFVAPYTHLSASTPLEHLTRAARYTGLWGLTHWLPLALAVWGSLSLRRDHSSTRPYLILLGWGLAAVWVQDKYFGYHWQTVLPPLALLAAVGSTRWSRPTQPPRLRQGVTLAVVALWAVLSLWSQFRDSAAVALGVQSRERWLQRFGRPGGGDHSFLADTWVADYVRRQTRPGEEILVWGFEPAVYLLADRWPRSRFFFNVPVTAPFAPAGWRQEFLEAMRTHPPALWITVRNDAIPWASGRPDDSALQLAAWPELRHWVEQNYRLDRQIEDFTILRRVRPAVTSY